MLVRWHTHTHTRTMRNEAKQSEFKSNSCKHTKYLHSCTLHVRTQLCGGRSEPPTSYSQSEKTLQCLLIKFWCSLNAISSSSWMAVLPSFFVSTITVLNCIIYHTSYAIRILIRRDLIFGSNWVWVDSRTVRHSAQLWEKFICFVCR